MNKLFSKIFENKYLVLVALIGPALLIYFKSVYFSFSTLDEQWMILDNHNLTKGWEGFKNTWTSAMAKAYYRPLLGTSILIDYYIGRLSPVIYHFSNILYHLLCVVLLYHFLRLNQISKPLAAGLSVLFSVHPIALHAVAWVPGRNDLLLCIFVLASLNALLRFFNSGSMKFLIFHFLFYVCALLTKENAVALTFIFLSFYALYSGENQKFFYVLIIGWAGLSLGWFFIRDSIVIAQPDLGFNKLFFKNVVPGILLFTGKSLLPVQQSIMPMLKYSSILPGIIALMALVVLSFWPGLKNKLLAGIGLLIFFGLLLIPVWFSAVKSNGEYYEHRMYTSMIGLVLFISQLKLNWQRPELKLAGLIIFCFFTVKTFNRLEVYRDENSFVMAGAEESPGYHLFQFQKSAVLFERKQYDSALVYVNRSLETRQDMPQQFTNRGSIYYMLGRYQESVADFSHAIKISSTFDYRMYLNRGFAYCKNNQPDSAMNDLLILKKCCATQIPKEFEEEVVALYKARKDSL